MSELDSVEYVILMEIHIHFRVLCILSTHLRCNFQNSQLGYPVVFASHKECGRPYGQTLPLEGCEQPDLKHPWAMLQNSICPQNSLGGEGFVS